MIQKGDDLINGNHQQYLCHQNFNNSPMAANVVQQMSFEDLLSQCESTLPPVETVLPHYGYTTTSDLPTTPPSAPSPSVNMTNINSVTITTQPQLQLQHQHELQTGTQHNHNIMMNHQQQQLELAPVHYNHMVIHNTNIPSTSTGAQLFVDHNFSNYAVNSSELKIENDAQETQNTSRKTYNDPSIYVSDASTVDAEENDNDNLSDEPFTYLKDLNSENLMKFSQQSELMQMMEQQIVETKVNLNSIPLCEEHDIGGYDFQVQVNSTDSHAQRPGVLFAKESQRLYVKAHENVYIDCSYKVMMPMQPLNVRAFAVYTNDTSDPVRRCQNHISKDLETDVIMRNNLVRCENPDAMYYGTDAGKTIRDRYSVVVPLNSTVKASDNHLKQQLIIHFTCNNSCMNRKTTSVVFLLETSKGVILAQRVLSVKISTCPKRDHRLYEGQMGSHNKRRTLVEPDFCPSGPKMAKYDDSCIKDEFSRSSYEDPSDDDASGHANADCGGGIDNFDVAVEKETGNFVLTAKYKTRAQMLQVLRLMYSNAITSEVFFEAAVNGRKKRDSEYLRRCYEKALRLKGRRQSHVDCP